MLYKKYSIYIIVLSCLVFTSCGKLDGTFAFKKKIDHHYRKMQAQPQFHKNESVQWVYVFKKFRGKHKIGVILLKKEVVWIDVLSWHDTINQRNKIIYGSIENFEAGEYKILLTEKDKMFAEQHFTIYDN